MKRIFIGCISVMSLCAQTHKLPPYTPSVRLHYFLHRTFAPTRMLWLLQDAGMSQLTADPAKWDQGLCSFGYRYGSLFGMRLVTNSAQLGAEYVLDQDGRYEHSDSQRLRDRVLHAVTSAVLAKSDYGYYQLAYGRMAAFAIGTAVSSTWYPQRVTTGTLAQGIGFGLLGQAENNLLDEFGKDAWQLSKKALRKLKHRNPHTSGAIGASVN